MKIDRNTLIQELARMATENMDLEDLMEFFFDVQVACLNKLSDEELEQQVIDYSELSIEDYLIEEFEDDDKVEEY